MLVSPTAGPSGPWPHAIETSQQSQRQSERGPANDESARVCAVPPRQRDVPAASVSAMSTVATVLNDTERNNFLTAFERIQTFIVEGRYEKLASFNASDSVFKEKLDACARGIDEMTPLLTRMLDPEYKAESEDKDATECRQALEHLTKLVDDIKSLNTHLVASNKVNYKAWAVTIVGAALSFASIALGIIFPTFFPAAVLTSMIVGGIVRTANVGLTAGWSLHQWRSNQNVKNWSDFRDQVHTLEIDLLKVTRDWTETRLTQQNEQIRNQKQEIAGLKADQAASKAKQAATEATVEAQGRLINQLVDQVRAVKEMFGAPASATPERHANEPSRCAQPFIPFNNGAIPFMQCA